MSTVRLIYSPLSISAPFYGYLKLLKLHWKERSRNKDVRSGNQTQDLLHQGREPTDCAILAPLLSSDADRDYANLGESYTLGDRLLVLFLAVKRHNWHLKFVQRKVP